MLERVTRVLTVARPARTTGRHRQAGDDARETSDWPAAARAYRAHLAEEPADTAIHVQLGHALKEQGLLTEAFAAYRQARDCDPSDADARLQLGRVLRLLGREAEAVAELSEAVRLNGSEDAVRELMALQEDGLAADVLEERNAGTAAQMVLFEIGDLFVYIHNHRTLSGIQRVMVNIIEQILSLPEDQGQRYRFVVADSEGRGTLSLPRDALRRLLRLTLASPPSDDEAYHTLLRVKIVELIGMGLPLRPVAGQTFFILGAFWVNGGLLERVRAMKAAGVRIGLYLYDLIPLTHSEFFVPAVTGEFALGLGDALVSLDFILAISEHVAQEMRSLLRTAGVPPVPVEAVTLAHILKPIVDVRTERRTSSDALSVLRDRPFVLAVSTIEARKNHAYLFQAWLAMIAAGEDVPDLVLVGRPGWMIDDFMKQLRNVDFLDGRIHVLHDISDDDLATLYRRCLFSVFPSIVEGWGLPVGESLAYGTPCAASNTSSIPEVGGNFVEYFDPHNLRDGLAVFRRMLFTEGYLERCRARIAAEFRPRTWREVCNDLIAALVRMTELSPRAGMACVPSLAAGRVFEPHRYAPGHGTRGSYLGEPLRTILNESWFSCEDIGVWMRGDAGSVAFLTDRPDCDILLFIEICGAPHVAEDTLNVSPCHPSLGRPEKKRRIALQANQSQLLRIAARTDLQGRVEVRLRLERPARQIPGTDDPRCFSVGLRRLAWAADGDLAARAEVLERLTMECGEP